MKSFKISCVDKDKKPFGEQTVSMSAEEVDQHKISFLGKDGNPLFTIDTDTGELVLDNTSGDFDEITTDKPIARIKVSNIKLDYEENITFSLDGSKTTYRIAGNAFEQKKGSSFVPVKTYDKPFDIVLPSTLFADMQASKININGFPFQMFEALTEEDKTALGIETFKSTSGLLNIIKIKDQTFIARGKKFIPVSLENQNYYKMGEKSVLGFTVGKNNGISGKQSQGIAFRMNEAELERVATFLNGSTDSITFKNEADFNSNDIDYTRVNKQSDLTKTLTGLAPGDGGDVIVDPGPDDDDDDDGSGETGGGGTTREDPPPPPKPDEPKKDDKKPEKDEPKKEEKKPEKIEFSLGALSTVLAATIGTGLISGFLLGPIAWIFFIFFAFSALANLSMAATHIPKKKKEKKSKKQKLQDKIDKKTKKLEKLKEKKPTKRNIRKITRLQNSIDKTQRKLNKLNGTATTTISEDDGVVVDESIIDGEMVGRTTTTATVTPATVATKKTIHTALDTALAHKPKNEAEYIAMVNDINTQVTSVCPDGFDVSTVAEGDKAFYQSCIDFRTAYIAEQSAKATYEAAVATGNADEIALADSAYKSAHKRLSECLNSLYASSATTTTTTTASTSSETSIERI